MKNKILMLALLMSFGIGIFAQDNKPKLYEPFRNADQQIDSALKIAKAQKKNVFIQVGGNWCSWCILFQKFYSTDKQIDSAMKASYVVTHLNYSKENKNLKALEKLDFPQRFGFPVIVILNPEGKRIHTQNTSYLEEGKGYNKEKVLDFINAWSPAVLDPEKYKN